MQLLAIIKAVFFSQTIKHFKHFLSVSATLNYKNAQRNRPNILLIFDSNFSKIFEQIKFQLVQFEKQQYEKIFMK